MNNKSMSTTELRAAATLPLVFFLRMLPLFMVLPVLAMAGENYVHATSGLIGIALGVNGLTQACLQIPFGMLSDRYGRKPVITAGLIMFICGSLLAAMADSIYGLIAGRALQGAGAVSAASMALAADLSREQIRTRIMALIGASIGIAFLVAFIIGPLLFAYVGLNGIFYIAAGCGVIAIAMLLFIVPSPTAIRSTEQVRLRDIKTLIKTPYLLKMDISIFFLHVTLMTNFVVIPIALRDFATVAASAHWKIYLIVMAISLVITVPLIVIGEKRDEINAFFITGILLVMFSQIGLFLSSLELISLSMLLVLFFGGFNYLEALMPSEITKNVAASHKGTAMGIFSAAQFIGIFCGGTIGGYLYQHNNINTVFLFCVALTIVWLIMFLAIPGSRLIKDKDRLAEEND